MKLNKLFLLTSFAAGGLITSGCTMCHTGHNPKHEMQQQKHHKHKKEHKNKQKSGTPVFQQTYSDGDVQSVNATIFTRSSKGGESEMGVINFMETDDGLKMMVDLIDLRPGKVYTTQIYQCGACNDSTCCDVAAMAVDLPTIQINNPGRLQESYIVRGLTATQLNNARVILTRDGGYKAAWGTLNQ